MAGAASGQWESAWWLGRSLREGGGGGREEGMEAREQQEGENKTERGETERERERKRCQGCLRSNTQVQHMSSKAL